MNVYSNDREEFAANIGGYPGAPTLGEFAFLIENHTGQSGPRHELQDMLGWLEERRQDMRMLGYKEDELVYLYDIPGTHTQHALTPSI